MSRNTLSHPIAWSAVGLVLLTVGCPHQAASTNTGLNSTVLGLADQQAINAALAALESATTATNTTLDVTQADQPTARETTCPAVEFSGGNVGGLSLGVSVDFGTGCSPESSSITCAGSASGSISTATGALELTFDALECDNKALNGDVAFLFANSNGAVTVTGDWGVTYTVGEDTIGLDATGVATFDSDTSATTFSTLVGTIDDNGDQYSCEWENVVTSVNANGNFIPQSGEINLSGRKIRTMTVRFNASSPSTGDVEVSINGGEFFAYNLFDAQ